MKVRSDALTDAVLQAPCNEQIHIAPSNPFVVRLYQLMVVVIVGVYVSSRISLVEDAASLI